MGDVGDQLGFHTLVFHTVFHGCVKAASNIVDIFGNTFIVARETVQRNLILEISAGDLLQAFCNLFPVP